MGRCSCRYGMLPIEWEYQTQRQLGRRSMNSRTSALSTWLPMRISLSKLVRGRGRGFGGSHGRRLQGSKGRLAIMNNGNQPQKKQRANVCKEGHEHESAGTNPMPKKNHR